MLRAGYFQSKLHTEFNKALKYIQLNYNSETFVKEIDKNDIDDLYYCGKITYDASSGNYRVIRNLLGGKNILKIRNVLVSRFKIYHLITRKKHLKKLRKYITQNKIEFVNI